MFVVGVDENGLGPRLGPLVATAISLELDHGVYDAERLRRIGDRAGVGDSKATAGFGAMAHTEGVALAILERIHGSAPSDLDTFLAMIAVDGPAELRSFCDTKSAVQCWSRRLALPIFGGSVSKGKRALARLERTGLRIRRAKSAIACPRAFNREVERRGSKLSVDLELFERLLLDAATEHGPLLAICGMVGGIRRYAPYLARISSDTLEVLEETRSRASYRAPEIGEVRFEVDCDAQHVPVALASMLGKYTRELFVERQNQFYRDHQPHLPAASGYYDPVTTRFIEATREIRTRLAIAPDCFERTS